MPSYLNVKQRKLISHRKFASQLENDPVYASIGDEEFRLEYIDPQRDIPNTAKVVKQVFELTKEHVDWQNWLSILQGLNKSRGVHSQWKEQFIRKAIRAGELDTVVQALKQVDRNGVSMGSREIRRELFLSLRNYAQTAGWTKEALQKTFQCARQAAELMEHPSHCGSRTVSANDPRAEPLVLGTLLELSARCANFGAYQTLAVDYIEKLVQTLEQQDNDLVSSLTLRFRKCANANNGNRKRWKRLKIPGESANFPCGNRSTSGFENSTIGYRFGTA